MSELLTDSSGAPSPSASGRALVTVDAPESPPSSSSPSKKLRPLLRPTLFYVLSRALTLAAMAVAAPIAHISFAGSIDRWDTVWFIRAASSGWPDHLVENAGHVKASTIAFFPVFPLVVRWLAELSGSSLLLSAATVSTVTGLTAVLAAWLLVRDYAGPAAADRGALLLAFFPGTFVFSLAYAEGILITFVALGFMALRRKRWLLAGLAGAIATAAAPVALAFCMACLWCAVSELRRSGRWNAFISVLLAPVGFVGYQLWLWVHTGNLSAWRLTERGGWHSYLSFTYPFHVIARLFTLSSTANMNVMTAGTVVAIVGLVYALRDRQPAALVVYAIGVAAAALFTSPVGLRPRFVLDAFPLILAIGTHLKGRKFFVVLMVSATLLAALSVYSVDTFAVFP